MPYYRRYKRRGVSRRALMNTLRGIEFGPRGTPASIDAFGEDYAKATDTQKLNRMRYKFRGKGKYSVAKFIRDAGALGEGIKKTYNSWIPKSIRDQAITIASKKLAAAGGGLYTGRGAYYANELVGGSGMVPMQVMGAGDETESVTIENREYITDVYAPSSSAFTVNAVRLNPGLAINFPWLSQLAMNYEEYEFQKLIFYFRSTIDIGNANTSGQSGTIIMACDYNASHGLFVNKESMMQYHGAISGKCTDDITCGIECDYSKISDLANFVRVGPVPSGEDPKTYDLGILQYAVNNVPSAMYNQQIGELWVEYKVQLRVPKLAVTRGYAQQRDVYSTIAATGCSIAQVFGSLTAGSSNLAISSQNSIGTNLAYSTASYPASATYAATGWTGAAGAILPTLSSPSVQSYTAAAGNLLLTLPAALNGNFKLTLQFMFTCAAAPTWTTFQPRVLFYGNVIPNADTYMPLVRNGGQYDSNSVPNSGISTSNSCMYLIPMLAASGNEQQGLFLELHFKTSAATGGVNNMILIGTAGLSVATITAWGATNLTIEEMNPIFDGAAMVNATTGAALGRTT